MPLIEENGYLARTAMIASLISSFTSNMALVSNFESGESPCGLKTSWARHESKRSAQDMFSIVFNNNWDLCGFQGSPLCHMRNFFSGRCRLISWKSLAKWTIQINSQGVLNPFQKLWFGMAHILPSSAHGASLHDGPNRRTTRDLSRATRRKDRRWDPCQSSGNLSPYETMLLLTEDNDGISICPTLQRRS
jgi:hypothetical protein